MALNLSDNQLLKRYLLGEVPRHLRKQIEKKFFEDDSFFDRLLYVEEQLMADYVYGKLTEDERLRFESSFLTSPKRQQRVEELRDKTTASVSQGGAEKKRLREQKGRYSLLERLRTLADRFRSVKMMQLAFASLLIIFLIALWMLYVRRAADPSTLSTEQPRMQGSPQVAAGSPSPGKIDVSSTSATPQPNASPILTPTISPGNVNPQRPTRNSGTPSSEGSSVAVVLVPGLLRGGSQLPVVRITPDTGRVALRATLFERKYETYGAELLTEEGRVVQRLPARKPQAADSVNFEIPSRLLTEDFYYLNLYGIAGDGTKTPVDKYPFNVEK